MDEHQKTQFVNNLIHTINEISSIQDYHPLVKKHFYNLARRLKLLIPMFEEIKETHHPLSDHSLTFLAFFNESLHSALDLLRFGSHGSKIYLAMEREQLTTRYNEVTSKLEQALDGIPYDELEISDEVQEQVELVLAQFRRAKGKVDDADPEFSEDLLSLYENRNDSDPTPDLLKRVAEKLHLIKIDDLTQESVALTEMVTTSGGDPDEKVENMCNLLKKIKDLVLTENLSKGSSTWQKNVSQSCGGQTSAGGCQRSLIIPDDFQCPLSLQLFNDPVIVSTGQTYERSCIEEWIKGGHKTCPKTKEPLQNYSLTPNYALRSLIAQWCEANGIEPPKRASTTGLGSKTMSACSAAEHSKIEELLSNLTSCNLDNQRSAAGEIRLLAKRNADNRIAIAEAGAIPLLIELLSTPDLRTQEHAVTALLNLSICDDNKGSIINLGAVPGIVHVLKRGTMEGRENSAATLFSLSVVDQHKVTIGAFGAIPPLVMLLSEGSQRGKKDAATALFNLCIYQGNKRKAIRAGIVPILMTLLTESQGGMMDEALAILAVLSSHPEGKVAIGSANALPVLVNVIGNGSPRNKENAAAVMVHLCVGGDHNSYLEAARELGVVGPLLDMAQNGTERGKRKAQQLLEQMNCNVGERKQEAETQEHHKLTLAEGAER